MTTGLGNRQFLLVRKGLGACSTLSGRCWEAGGAWRQHGGLGARAVGQVRRVGLGEEPRHARDHGPVVRERPGFLEEDGGLSRGWRPARGRAPGPARRPDLHGH